MSKGSGGIDKHLENGATHARPALISLLSNESSIATPKPRDTLNNDVVSMR
jgi:hypothetical protein